MNIMVTGGSGWIGRFVVHDLLKHGHEVLSVDLTPPISAQNREQTSITRYKTDVRHLTVNITDAGEVYQALASIHADAVVHLAAWPDPGLVPDTKTYGDNVQGTFNIFQACKDTGVNRVVSASSSQVYGLANYAPVYVPLDETHPTRPLNCYAAAKIAGEQAATYFSDQYGLTICSFRFQGVRLPTHLSEDIDMIMQNPAEGRLSLWTRVDVRDAATACRLAVEKEELPSGIYNITGSRVVLDTPTADLIQQFYGTNTAVRTPIEGFQSPMSCQRAEDAFGYRPAYQWSESQRHLEEDE